MGRETSALWRQIRTSKLTGGQQGSEEKLFQANTKKKNQHQGKVENKHKLMGIFIDLRQSERFCQKQKDSSLIIAKELNSPV